VELKNCPHCDMELPSELSFCPYCMRSFVQKDLVIVPLNKRAKRWPVWFCLGAIILIIGVVIWLVFPWSEESETITSSHMSVLVDSGVTSISGLSSERSDVSTPHHNSGSFTGSDSGVYPSSGADLSVDSLIPAPDLPISPSVIVSSASPVSSETTSSESTEQLPALVQRIYESSIDEFSTRKVVWNQTATNAGYDEYVIEDYSTQPYLNPHFLNVDEGFALRLQEVTLANDIKLHFEWTESAVQEPGTDTYCTVSASISVPKAMRSLKVYGRVKYLLLATFSGHENTAFVNSFYNDEDWGEIIHRNSGVHNGYSYRKSGLYHGFFFEDSAYTVYFEDEPINKDIIEANGSNVSYNTAFSFEKRNTVWWQEQHQGYVDYS